MFSIVIPTKNEEDYLPILLRSIKGQTVQPIEVIVADAGSTDKTIEIAKKFGCRIVPGGLPGIGRNHGAAVAKGGYILFLGSDVKLIDKHFLEKAERELTQKKLDFASCDVEAISNKKIDRAFHEFYNHFCRAFLPIHAHAPGFCIFAKRSKHAKLGGFDESIVFCEDHDYAQRCRKFGKFGYLDTIRIHVSTRRFDRDGRLNIAVKYTLGELHLMTLGPVRHNHFKYEFGHQAKKK